MTAAVARIGVLASGQGSNLQAVMDACRTGSIDGEVAVVVSHSSPAPALERARRADVPAFALPLVDRRDPEARRQHERRVLRTLEPFRLDLLVLAGWMLILSEGFLRECGCPVINVHPALLQAESGPVLRGAHAVRDALELGLAQTGVSVHIVTPEVDAGPVILDQAVPIAPDDDEERLYRRIKTVEHRLLPRAIQRMLSQAHGGGDARDSHWNGNRFVAL